MADIQSLTQERTQLYKDVFDHKIPKRVPVNGTVSTEFAIQYSGKNLLQAQWDTAQNEAAYERICQDFYSDSFPINGQRFASVYKLLGARNFVMGSGGFLQHPEIEGLKQEEYEEFIASPYDTIVEKVLPRLYTELNVGSGRGAIVLSKAFKAWMDETVNLRAAAAKLSAKYGYAALPYINGFSEAPMDFVADQLRGFKGISMDIRRDRGKVKAAAEAVLPLMVKMGQPGFRHPYGSTFIPLHMPPFMREQDFLELYWPTFKQMVEELDVRGQACTVFAEQDWTRYCEYLNELPASTRIMLEYGDPKTFKEKVGKKHVLNGLYPTTLLKSGTKQQCLAKAKELLEIMAPGGNFLFSLDKMPLTVDSVNIENLKAVWEYVSQNAAY